MSVNIFATAVLTAQSAPKDKGEKTSKQIIAAASPEEIDQLFELRAELKDKEAQAKMLEGSVKHFGKQTFLAEALKQDKRPASFYLQGKKHKMLFIAQDRYTEKDLPSGLPEAITETEVTYQIPTDIVNQYGEQLSAALAGANIPDDVKARIITAIPKTKIKKGSIELVRQHPVVADLIVYQLKS